MSYSGPFINSIFKTDNIKNNSDIIQLSTSEDAKNTGIASHGASSRNIKITYNGTAIDTYAHSTPMLTMNHSYNRTDAGILISITNKINLKGKIYGIDRSGVANLLADQTNLKNLFFSCPMGNLKVLCNSAVLLDATGVRATNFNTEPSSDNMLRSIGYSIDLEYHERQSEDVTSPLIVSCSDSWSIEPLEDYVYESLYLTPSMGTEPTPPLVGTRTLPSNQLNIVNIPQFRVSHRISAKGASYTSSSSPCPTTGSGYFVPYDEARKWVSKRLDVPWLSSNSDGAYVGTYHSSSAGSKLYLFNHVRATNFSMTEGSYDIVDTWIGMPTGINHIEDYSIEIGSDEKFVKSVKVQGTIKGLEIVDQNRLKTNTSLTPTDAGLIHLNNSFIANNDSTSSISYSSHNTLSDKTTMKGYKYQNALLAWHSGIKPYLYTRASSALTRSISTTKQFDLNGTGIVEYYNRDIPKGSTEYASERLLNPIPWTMTEGHDHKKGIITYNYEYNNKFTLLDGVLSENITVTNTGPADVIAEVFVLGRSLGPVLQFLGSKTLTTKDLSIEISVMPPESIGAYSINNLACPLYTGGALYKAIEKLVDGIRPFRPYNTVAPTVWTAPTTIPNTRNTTGKSYIDRDTRTWIPSEGRYTRNISWKYQQCDTTKFYLDH